MAQRILLTGAAGFIGFHVASRLIARGDSVVGLDNLNAYYDPALKRARLAQLDRMGGDFACVEADVADPAAVGRVFAGSGFDRVVHLAAQAGVRHSLERPGDYIQSNVVGFANLLEACRHSGAGHLTYASTSSVYGANTALPYSEHAPADHPLQLYAATKRANELMAHSYSHLFALPTTGLRFFTVYGPWGRPDMSPWLFTEAILEGRPIKVFNHGRHSRDFTYVGDIAEGVIRASDAPARANPEWDAAAPDPASSSAPWRLYNIGASRPVQLSDYIAAIEAATGRKAILDLLPMQPGDVPDTFADTSELSAATGYSPSTPLAEGVQAFVDWFRAYRGM